MLEKDFPDTSTFEQINAVPFDEESELTEIEVEEMFGKVRALKNLIAEAQNRRDNFQTLYRQKIARAEEIFQTDTQYYSAELDAVTKRLRRFAEKNITGKKRSMKFPSGTLSFTKQTPQFFIGGQAVTNDNPKLIELARSLDAELIQSKETAKWGELKKLLTVDDDGNVLFKDTGEVIADMRAYTEPDKFKVETA